MCAWFKVQGWLIFWFHNFLSFTYTRTQRHEPGHTSETINNTVCHVNMTYVKQRMVILPLCCCILTDYCDHSLAVESQARCVCVGFCFVLGFLFFCLFFLLAAISRMLTVQWTQRPLLSLKQIGDQPTHLLAQRPYHVVQNVNIYIHVCQDLATIIPFRPWGP